MHIQVVLIFLILTIAIHVVLQKVNTIFLDNQKMKQKLDESDTESDSDGPIDKDINVESDSDSDVSVDNIIDKLVKDIKKKEEKEKEEKSLVTSNIVVPILTESSLIEEDDLRSDLLDFIKESKTTKIITDNKANIPLSKDNQKYTQEPGYLGFGEQVERELKTDEYDLKTTLGRNSSTKGTNDNITLQNSDIDEQSKQRVYYTKSANQFKTLKVDKWVYKDEKLMNGGKNDGIAGFDPVGSCGFAAL